MRLDTRGLSYGMQIASELEKTSPCQYLALSLIKETLDFHPPEVQENTFMLLKAIQSVVVLGYRAIGNEHTFL